MAGHDERGRPIKRKLRDLMDRTLVQAAIKEDLGAIRIIKEYEFKHAQLRRAEEPDAETLRAQKEKEEQKKVLSERLVNELTLISTLRFLGIVETGGDGRLTIAPWAQEASQARNRSPSGEGGG